VEYGMYKSSDGPGGADCPVEYRLLAPPAPDPPPAGGIGCCIVVYGDAAGVEAGQTGHT
jgi:hypothetical protein